jgi:hypothetical protein
MKAIEKTLEQIKSKAQHNSSTRMPNLKAIKELLDFYNIKSSALRPETTFRTRGCGIAKEGYSLTFTMKSGSTKKLDTTCPYYSMNASLRAHDILQAIEEQN